MPNKIPLISVPQDLVTTQEARRDGFLEIALRRNTESIPYIEQGRALWAKLKAETKTCEDILSLPELRYTLLLAAGFSVKAQGNMSEEDKTRLLSDFVDKVLRPNGRKYVDEIVYRYLLSLGEQLGGRMRNVIGVVARAKLSRSIVASLRINGFPFAVHPGRGEWVDSASCRQQDAEQAKAIRWNNDGHMRMLVHNVNVPGVSKNVDMVVFDAFSDSVDAKGVSTLMSDYKHFVVMGELKGGIDPAGADEHWKTARTALDRVRATFKKVYVAFLGAAIEKAMAEEIFQQLQSGLLDCAANLTNDQQLASFSEWLVTR